MLQRTQRTLTAIAFATVLAAPAFAQPATSGTATKPDTTVQSSMPATGTADTNFLTTQNATDWRGSKLIGASVYGPDNASIGEIDDVLVTNDGNIGAIVIGVGGFLGVGEKSVAIPFNAITITRKLNSDSIDKVSVSYTKDQLKNAPKFAYLDASSSTTGASPRNTAPAPSPAAK
jgi:hypothetical protein